MNSPVENDEPCAAAERVDVDCIPRSSVADDIAKCEILISHASSIGVRCMRSDVRAVKGACAEIAKGSLSPETEEAFYAAMSRIVDRVPYPSLEIAADLKLCCEVVSHAVRTGKPVNKSDLEALSKARMAQCKLEWNSETEVSFYQAMSHISHSVAPVVAETASVEARKGARRAIRNYTISAGVLTLCVLILSCSLFIIKQISEDISTVVERNDPIAITMHNQLQAYGGSIVKANEGATPELLAEMQNSPGALEIKEGLQKFATNNRQLYADVNRAKAISEFLFRFPNLLGHFLFKENWGDDWGGVNNRYTSKCPRYPQAAAVKSYDFTGSRYGLSATSAAVTPALDWQCDAVSIRHALEIDLPIFAVGESADKKRHIIPQDAINQGFQKIAVYQDIRAMATYARDIILAFVGSLTGFLLPILYAWLGACASILRQLRSDSAACLFHPEYSKVANRSHLMTAVIVGISIGLFSNLVRGGTEVSPLAVAFVAGYASDKFFEFVDRLVHAMFPSDSTSDESGRDRKRELLPKATLRGRGLMPRGGARTSIAKWHRPV